MAKMFIILQTSMKQIMYNNNDKTQHLYFVSYKTINFGFK